MINSLSGSSAVGEFIRQGCGMCLTKKGTNKMISNYFSRRSKDWWGFSCICLQLVFPPFPITSPILLTCTPAASIDSLSERFLSFCLSIPVIFSACPSFVCYDLLPAFRNLFGLFLDPLLDKFVCCLPVLNFGLALYLKFVNFSHLGSELCFWGQICFSNLTSHTQIMLLLPLL